MIKRTSTHLRSAMRAAFTLAASRNAFEVMPSHLFSAILSLRNTVTSVLGRHGTDLATVRVRIDALNRPTGTRASLGPPEDLPRVPVLRLSDRATYYCQQAQTMASSGRGGSLPTSLNKCLGRASHRKFVRRLNMRSRRNQFIKDRNQSGFRAIGQPGLVGNNWYYRPVSGPTKQHAFGKCNYMVTTTIKGPPPPGYLAPKGAPCRPQSIGLNDNNCGPKVHGDAEACAVLWERGNACGCHKWGFDPGEVTAIRIRNACGCSRYTGPGGSSSEVQIVHPVAEY